MSWASIIELGTVPVIIPEVKIEKKNEIIKVIEYLPFNLRLRANILDTRIGHSLFDEWEYTYFSHLKNMFCMLVYMLEHQDFQLNDRNTMLINKFNHIIFNKSSRFIDTDIEHTEYTDDIYDTYFNRVDELSNVNIKKKGHVFVVDDYDDRKDSGRKSNEIIEEKLKTKPVDIELAPEIRLSEAIGNFGLEFDRYCVEHYLLIGEGLRHDDIYYFLMKLLSEEE
tara:strand:+ start:130 stop:801 length:672 start_codon:yes stop_codon:yes gene_type:complete